MTPWDIHWFDREGNHHVFGCYAHDSLHARHTAEELLKPDLARISGIIPANQFDW